MWTEDALTPDLRSVATTRIGSERPTSTAPSAGEREENEGAVVSTTPVPVRLGGCSKIT
jgi:hypothetical protein